MGRPIKDLTGQRFGSLIALCPTNERCGTNVIWECQCDCGNKTNVRTSHLTGNSIQSCGCSVKHDLIKKKFGRLTVISDSGERSHLCIMWKCVCDCGNSINVRTDSLISGNTKSCGCLWKESVSSHGASHSLEYYVWGSLIQRCTNSNHEAYQHYGGRGIKVCDRWINSFENFIADMGPRPSENHSIDRRDNDGNYEPSNCKWSTASEQQNNRRDNVVVTYNDNEYSGALLAREHSVNPRTFTSRLNRGWSVKDAVEIPVKKSI